MEGIQVAAFAPLLAVILCASLGNCCMTRGLRATIQSLEHRLQTLESVVPARPTPHVVLAPPPQLPPLSSLPQTYYYPQQSYAQPLPPYPSAPRTSSVI